MSTGVRSPGRQILVAVYAVFAISAGARSAVKLTTQFDQAPVAYLLSAFAAVVYLVATVALRYRGSRAFAVALASISVEMVGVLTVGTISVVNAELLPDQTVWSNFGSGYGYVPLVLQIIGLIWLWRQARNRSVRTAPSSA